MLDDATHVRRYDLGHVTWYHIGVKIHNIKLTPLLVFLKGEGEVSWLVNGFSANLTLLDQHVVEPTSNIDELYMTCISGRW